MTIAGPESCLRNITLSYSELLIAQFEVYLRYNWWHPEVDRKDHQFSEEDTYS